MFSIISLTGNPTLGSKSHTNKPRLTRAMKSHSCDVQDSSELVATGEFSVVKLSFTL